MDGANSWTSPVPTAVEIKPDPGVNATTDAWILQTTTPDPAPPAGLPMAGLDLIGVKAPVFQSRGPSAGAPTHWDLAPPAELPSQR